MSPELEKAIARTQKLFRERDASEDWARNIIEGGAGLSTQRDWLLFYSFLTNPGEFNPDADLVPAEDVVIPPPDPQYKIMEYKNGDETTIVYKRRKEEDDEKAAA